MKQTTRSSKDTINFGKKIATKLKGGNILLLQGNLGAGKTTFVKGLAQGMGIVEEITSPTFALMNIYETKKLRLIHVDTYRLKNEQELIEIGVEDYLGDKNTVCVIEWPEKIKTLLKNKKTILINIEHVDENTRCIKVSS